MPTSPPTHNLQFIATPIIRAGIGCLLSVFYCMLYREWLPYQRLESNMLALAAQYQVMFTFVGAFIVLSSDFQYDHTILGMVLVVVNFIVLPYMTYLGTVDMRQQEAKDKRSRKLQLQMVRGSHGSGLRARARASYTY